MPQPHRGSLPGRAVLRPRPHCGPQASSLLAGGEGPPPPRPSYARGHPHPHVEQSPLSLRASADHGNPALVHAVTMSHCPCSRGTQDGQVAAPCGCTGWGTPALEPRSSWGAPGRGRPTRPRACPPPPPVRLAGGGSYFGIGFLANRLLQRSLKQTIKHFINNPKRFSRQHRVQREEGRPRTKAAPRSGWAGPAGGPSLGGVWHWRPPDSLRACPGPDLSLKTPQVVSPPPGKLFGGSGAPPSQCRAGEPRQAPTPASGWGWEPGPCVQPHGSEPRAHTDTDLPREQSAPCRVTRTLRCLLDFTTQTAYMTFPAAF